MAHSEAKIVVAVDAGGSELCGTVRTERVPDQPFTGWLGLLTALQVAVEAVGAQEVAAG